MDAAEVYAQRMNRSRRTRVADRVIGVVYLGIGVGLAVGAGFALARSDWREVFVDLFILGVGIVPIMLSRRRRYVGYRLAKLSHPHPTSN